MEFTIANQITRESKYWLLYSTALQSGIHANIYHKLYSLQLRWIKTSSIQNVTFEKNNLVNRLCLNSF